MNLIQKDIRPFHPNERPNRAETYVKPKLEKILIFLKKI